MILSPFEWTIAKRYMLPGRGEALIALVASISIGVVMLSVAMLIIVMSVMNGFRADLIDKLVRLNGHAIVHSDGPLRNWQQVLAEVRKTEGVVKATPVIEKPLIVVFNGRVDAIAVRGQSPDDIDRLASNVVAGDLGGLKPGQNNIAMGSRLAANLGARLGDAITVISVHSTSDGVGIRQIGYTISAVFETGLYDYDETFVVMPLQDAQALLLMGNAIEKIEVTTTDIDRVGEILAPLARKLRGEAEVSDWKTLNRPLFEALEVERVAMFFALSIIMLVAAFNILSSLIMLVRAKTRDIAILRTMGATRRSLLKIFVTAGSAIGAIGTFAGLLLGLIVLQFRQSFTRAIEAIAGQNLSDPSVRFLTELPAKIDTFEVMLISAMAMGLSFLATLYPAYRAAGADPVLVLRYE